MPTEQTIKINEAAAPVAASAAASESVGAEIIQAYNHFLEASKTFMAIAAENLKAKQDTEKKSQEVWNEAKAKHEAASNAADVAIKKFEEARKIAQAYRKEAKAAIKIRDETQKELDEAKVVHEADRKAVLEAKKYDQEVRANNEATKRLRSDAAERHDVIDLIADDEDNEDNKTDGDVEDTKLSGKPSATYRRGAGSNKKARHDTYDVYIPDEIIVEGCGTPEANGTYTYTECDQYVKAGKWNGCEGKFVLRRDGNGYWCISTFDQRSISQRGRVRFEDLYYHYSRARSVPPSGEWVLHNGGNPPPKIIHR